MLKKVMVISIVESTLSRAAFRLPGYQDHPVVDQDRDLVAKNYPALVPSGTDGGVVVDRPHRDCEDLDCSQHHTVYFLVSLSTAHPHPRIHLPSTKAHLPPSRPKSQEARDIRGSINICFFYLSTLSTVHTDCNRSKSDHDREAYLRR